MTTNKPEVVAWYTPPARGTLPVVALNDRSKRGEPLIRLSDYEALQAEYRILESELATVKKVAYGNVDLLDECEKLRADNSELREKQPNPDVSALVEALESLLEVQDEDCRYDHQGYCQNHNLDHVDDGCRVARAKTALAAYRSQGGNKC